ncbi:hypothetical protein HQ563_17935 [bacterium]|nr:hypothetical protein [bacterium]
METITDAERKRLVQEKVRVVDRAVPRRPELQSLWCRIRKPVVDQIESLAGQELQGARWPPLFLWLSRRPSEAATLEQALAAMKKQGGRGEFAHATSQLVEIVDSRQAYSRIIEIVMIGRCLERSQQGEVQLHPVVNPPSRKRADLAVRVGTKQLYVEITVLTERMADEHFTIGIRDPKVDGGRIIAKLLDELAEQLDPTKSQLSATAPNVIILMSGAVVGAYEHAFDWAFGALEDYPDRLRAAASSRARKRGLARNQEQLNAIVASFSRISAILLFEDVLFRGCVHCRTWRSNSAKFPLDETELDQAEQLFREPKGDR